MKAVKIKNAEFTLIHMNVLLVEITMDNTVVLGVHTQGWWSQFCLLPAVKYSVPALTLLIVLRKLLLELS